MTWWGPANRVPKDTLSHHTGPTINTGVLLHDLGVVVACVAVMRRSTTDTVYFYDSVTKLTRRIKCVIKLKR